MTSVGIFLSPASTVPTQETTTTTMIVLAATVVMALILWGLDGIIVEIVSFITGLGI